jgi:cytochrome c peroxidase
MFIVLIAVVFIVSPAVLAQLSPKEELGKSIFFDKISSPDWMSCSTCHAPQVGFTGPLGGINKHGAVYRGATPKRFGNRKPPSAAYASVSPLFNYDPGEGLFYGGNFWNGRATGWALGNPAADQALGPFLNPVEQNNPDKLAVLEQIASSKYSYLWEEAWGHEIDLNNVDEEYGNVGLSIAAFEGSAEVNQFSSKFDAFWDAVPSSLDVTAIDETNYTNYYGYGLNDEEVYGLAIFNSESKGKCSLCHILDEDPDVGYPLFTDFTFDNLGVPKNPQNPFYDMDEVYLDDGTPINPLGEAWIDYGLGDFLRQLAVDNSWRSLPHVTANVVAMTPAVLEGLSYENDGKQKVPTLRNLDKRDGNNFPKAFAHNGYFKSLEEITHFYNTRDVSGAGWNGIPWPDPEVFQNVNTDELGDLGLSADEEAAIVSFMKTLSDGYIPSNSTAMSQPKSGGAGLRVAGPNPFNPETNFLYTVSEPGNVKIEVFNITGQRMATLVNDWKLAGDYPLKWYAAQYPSGIYFIRLSTNHEVLVKKVSLIK